MILKTLPWKQPPLFPRSTCWTIRSLRSPALCEAVCFKRTAALGMVPKHGISIVNSPTVKCGVEYGGEKNSSYPLHHSHKAATSDYEYPILHGSSCSACVEIHMCFLTAQNDNVLLIGSRTRDFVTGALGRNPASPNRESPTNHTWTGDHRGNCPGLRWLVALKVNFIVPGDDMGVSWRFLCSCERLTMWYAFLKSFFELEPSNLIPLGLLLGYLK